jgi:hypothetical protein
MEAELPTDATAEPTSAIDDEFVYLPHGKALRFDELSPITGRSRARLVVLAGLPETGKTTLIAALFHCFLKGPFAGYSFCESQTLLAFDERCHDARIASKREKATTPRTGLRITDLILHLKVCSETKEGPTDVLLLDMSGEDQDAMRDSVDECQNFPGLRRADHFVLLLDGEKLGDLTQRQKAKNDAFVLLRSCCDSGLLRPQSFIDIIVTKWDIVQESSAYEQIESFVHDVEREAHDRFQSKCAKFRFCRIAASPTTQALPFGWGLEAIFASWVEDIPERFHVSQELKVGPTTTEIDRFRLVVN